jgi:hypothetical protein
MNTNLGLSPTTTGQIERMIDDAAWLTYPIHMLVNVIKTFVYGFPLIAGAVMFMIVWMVTAHDQRAELTKDFVTQESVYRVNVATNAITTQRAGQVFVPASTLDATFNACSGTGEQLKNPMLVDRNWLAEKNDVFQSAYIAASHNLAALKVALHRSKEPFQPMYSFRYTCVEAIQFLERTDAERQYPADAKYNWFTGICLVGANCSDADFVPRNDSIYADAITPQVTKNQGAALKALNATGTPEFWIAAAHANGIYDHDADFTSYAAMQQAQLAKDLSHDETPEEETAHEFEAVSIGIVLFIVFIGAWIARRTYKFNHYCEN